MSENSALLADLIAKIATGVNVSEDDLTALGFLLKNSVSPRPNYISGQVYNPCPISSSLAPTGGLVAEKVYLAPFSFATRFETLEASLNVTSAVSSSRITFYIYTSNASGYPDVKAFTSKDVSGAVVTNKTTLCPFVFEANTLYWIGVQCDLGNVRISGLSINLMMNLGTTDVNTTMRNCIVSNEYSYRDAPEKWNFNPTQLANETVFPMIQFKCK